MGSVGKKKRQKEKSIYIRSHAKAGDGSDLGPLIRCGQSSKGDGGPVLRVQEHQNRWCMLVGGGKSEGEALEDYGKGQFGLQDG